MRTLLVTAILLALTAAGARAANPPRPCVAPEHRQLDFWVGNWDLQLRARSAPDKDEWAEAKATQKIESILAGCVISENFTAAGPGTPWAGKSYSVWVPKLGKWRQTWVDDQGGYIALTGGVEDGVMALYGEPREQNGKTIRMRMVWLDVKKDSLRWEWQQTTDGGATWTPMLVIDYKRRR